MLRILVAVLVLAITQYGIVAAEVDYCAPAYMCGSQHIRACNHTGFNPKYCTINAKLIDVTQDFKTMFVDEHNKYRNEIAEGLIYEPAAGMATLEWDDELARLAEFNVKECTIKYEDACLTSNDYWYIDQNIGNVYYSRYKYQFNEITEQMILADIPNAIKGQWYEQKRDCTQVEVDNYKPPLQLIMSFGRMMMDRNTKVGCAISLYENEYNIYGMFTCNYARRLFCEKPIFRSGPYPGSKCTSGMNPRYPFLCSAEEYFNLNNYALL